MRACFVMSIAAATFSSSVAEARIIEDLDTARPAAAALLEQSVVEWRAAPAIVRDAVGFQLFHSDFPAKRQMSQDDMIACMNRLAATADNKTAVATLFQTCAGLR